MKIRTRFVFLHKFANNGHIYHRTCATASGGLSQSQSIRCHRQNQKGRSSRVCPDGMSDH
jgi:hypothetical protein